MDLVREAQIRWLKPGEVLFILQNFEENQLTHEPPQKPPSNVLLVYFDVLLLKRYKCVLLWFAHNSGILLVNCFYRRLFVSV